MKRILVGSFVFLVAAAAIVSAVPGKSQPRWFNFNLGVGDEVTAANNDRPVSIIDSAFPELRIIGVASAISGATPKITLSHRTTPTGSDVEGWQIYPDSSGLNVKNSVAGTTPFSISSAGVTTISSAVLTAATYPSASSFASPVLTGTPSITGPLVYSGATGTGEQGNTTLFSLTDGAAAATFAKVTVASNSYISGQIIFTVEANDATNFQARGGVAEFAAVNKAGTITCGVSTQTSAVEALGSSSGTLANTFTCADAGSGVMNLLDAADTSLTVGAGFVRLRYRINVTGTATVTPQ